MKSHDSKAPKGELKEEKGVGNGLTRKAYACGPTFSNTAKKLDRARSSDWVGEARRIVGTTPTLTRLKKQISFPGEKRGVAGSLKTRWGEHEIFHSHAKRISAGFGGRNSATQVSNWE